MPHDVFISYASQDKPTADAACAFLEARQVRCWIAPRDILPGREWSEAIIDAIEGARIMVLVFSARTNASRQIVREVERAVNKGLTIITLRIEDVAPGRNLEYFLGTPHWLDAITPPMEQHLAYLADTVQVLLGSSDVTPVLFPRPAPAVSLGQLLSRREVLLGISGVAGLIALGFATGVIGGGGDGPNGGGSTSEGALDSRLAGAWSIESALTNNGDGSNTDWSISVERNGDYTGTIVIKDEGTLVAQLISSTPGLTMTPARGAAGYSRYTSWEQSGDNAKSLTSALVPSTLLLILSNATIGAATSAFLNLPEDYKRVSGAGPGLTGRWEREAKYGSMLWKIVFDVKDNSRYTFEATLQDTGRMTASNGKWRQVSEANGLQEGDYEILNADSVIFKNSSLTAAGPMAQVTWRRAGKGG